MNQPPTKSLVYLSIQIGILAFTYFNICLLSFEMWFKSDQLYNYHMDLFWFLSLVALISGLFIRIKSLNDLSWKVGTSILLILNAIVYGTFLILEFEERNENVMLLVAEVNTIWIYFMIGLGIFLRFLSTEINISILKKISIVFGGSIVGAIIYYTISLLPFIYIIHLWIIAIILIGIIIRISRMISAKS
jgi:hypothetical protein